MTLNDFKSINGDRAMGLRSLPAMLGATPAAKLACAVMLLPQLVVIALLVHWQAHWFALAIGILVIAQCLAMVKLLKDPERYAPWYNGTGVTAYVAGMMIAASALGSVVGATS
jgi:chlorophyll synthase